MSGGQTLPVEDSCAETNRTAPDPPSGKHIREGAAELVHSVKLATAVHPALCLWARGRGSNQHCDSILGAEALLRSKQEGEAFN